MGLSYHITEPHPSIPSASTTIYYGRGGAGNKTRITPSTITPGPTASGPASRLPLSPPPSNARFLSGRGGAGNVHREKERAMFSFDEELAQQERLRENAAPVYHIGRGGAGNFSGAGGAGVGDERARMGRVDSNASDVSSGSERESSGSAGGNVRRSLEGVWGKVSRGFSR
ncbi:unnamed protein product [Periconia digitata]|uniref:Uncharacterized protein n=1 Tax=Periconia digitata TaxID=1303443 RepID=A0A9W4UVY2_9PLEO|nr:unnamed protein product [Periconia digitata]